MWQVKIVNSNINISIEIIYIYLPHLPPHCEGGGVYDLSNNRFDTITTLGGFKSLKTVYPTTGVGSYV